MPGLERSPAEKLNTNGKREEELLALSLRWRDEAIKSGQEIKRIAVAFESGRDGFWLARRPEGPRQSKGDVIHAASTAVSREHRRAKTDRLDVEAILSGRRRWPLWRGDVHATRRYWRRG